MSDLQNLLLARAKNSHWGKIDGGYWGNFKFLNKIESVSIDKIHATLLQQSNLVNNENFVYLNKFIFGGIDKTLDPGLINDLAFRDFSQKFTEILDRSNKGAENQNLRFSTSLPEQDWTKDNNLGLTKVQWNDKRFPITEKIEQAKKEMDEVFKQLNSSSKEIEGLKIKTIELLNSTLKEIDGYSNKQFAAEKGRLFEQLATARLKETFVGKEVLGSGDIYSEAIKAQMATDVFLLPEQSLGLLKVKVLENGNNKVSLTLDQIADKISESGYSVSIPIESEELLEKKALLRVQVKSGRNQAIVNKHEKAVSLHEVAGNSDHIIKPLIWLMANEQEMESQPAILKAKGVVKTPWFIKDKMQNYKKTGSETLATYSNYLLNKSIIIKKYLSKNDVYLTENGFETSSMWLQRHPSARFSFTPLIKKISINTYDTPRNIVLKS